MSLKNAIHRYWENTADLVEQVPIANIVTGKIPDDLITRPFVVIADAYDSEHDSSTVIIQEHTVTFTVTADNDEVAELIVQLIETWFDDSVSKPRMHMDGGEELLASFVLSSSVDEPEPGSWIGTVTMRFLVGTTVESPVTYEP